MKIDPIHQFNIEPIFTIGHIGKHTIAFTNSSLYMFITVAAISLYFCSSPLIRAWAPSGTGVVVAKISLAPVFFIRATSDSRFFS